MSRVGARREREGVVPRATGVPRLANPARHARYAREGDPFRVTAPQSRPAFTPARQQARRAGADCRRLVALGVAPHRPPIATDASGCRGYLVCRAGFAGRDTPLAQAIERYNSLSGPDPRSISGRPPNLASLSLAAAVPVHEIAVVALLVVVPHAVAARLVPIVHEDVVYTVRVPRCGMRMAHERSSSRMRPLPPRSLGHRASNSLRSGSVRRYSPVPIGRSSATGRPRFTTVTTWPAAARSTIDPVRS